MITSPSSFQFAILTLIRRRPGLRQMEIDRFLYYQKKEMLLSSINNMLQRFKHAGYIEKEGRGWKLTKEGEEYLRSWTNFLQAAWRF